ncbi:hypothetical protein [Flammeovirga kamogawensis]|uniref:Tetratricopeptide repeat protein n=1 Tax=Flammeovirga kamogawensis TaxID=373891 RepID=A0ABX8GWD0_9BACT|nr:hypothetical protein [Flammeovirga kamogawensis]MBB6461058.1 hypothetical protein [Flammeovirga kamogawensis]QWG07628.1 hypothetical protein KM029_01420 [Flammeovirga kamogawensis]TRX69438.1 hypothetical protein EO216_15360 [Flammeovirga kamogawensis]
MNIHINTWLRNPSNVSEKDAEEIKKAIEKYPYFSALRVLLAKANDGEDEYVKSAAAYVSHRPSLQAFLNTTFDSNVNLPTTSEIDFEDNDLETIDLLSNEVVEEVPIVVDKEEVENEIQTEEIKDDSIVTPTPVEEKIKETIDEPSDLEEKILHDLEENSTIAVEEESVVSTSIADEILAELAKISQGIDIDEETSVNSTNEVITEEEEIEPNHSISTPSIDSKSEDDLMSSDEMLDRFKGFLETKNKAEEDIIDELSKEEDIDSDILAFSNKENIEIKPIDTEFPIYTSELADETANESDYVKSTEKMDDLNIIDFNQFAPNSTGNTSHQKEIIDKFISDSPGITSQTKNNSGDEKSTIDLSESSTQPFSSPQTESFAKLLEKQGKKDEAISIYQHLILKNPNKASFFAERIEFLKQN